LKQQIFGRFIREDKEKDQQLDSEGDEGKCEDDRPEGLASDIVVYLFEAVISEVGNAHSCTQHQLHEGSHRTGQFSRRNLFYNKRGKDCKRAYPVSLD
jgi:hypothetical protein